MKLKKAGADFNSGFLISKFPVKKKPEKEQ